MIPTFETMARFRDASQDEMVAWLAIAVQEHFEEAGGALAFRPFDGYFAGAESEADALATGLSQQPARTRVLFEGALARYLHRVPSNSGEVWLFASELALRLDMPEVVDAMERIFNPHFLTQLERATPNIIDNILALVRQISPSRVGAHSGTIALFRRLVNSETLQDSAGQLTLLRMCEIDPDNWTSHVAVTRLLLHKQMTRINDTSGYNAMVRMQNRLASSIFEVIGFDRLAAQLGELLIVPDAPNVLASDNWLWRALLERGGGVIPQPNGKIALATNPGRALAVKNTLVNRVQFSSIDRSMIPIVSSDADDDAGSLAEDDDATLMHLIPLRIVDIVLGQNQLPVNENEAE